MKEKSPFVRTNIVLKCHFDFFLDKWKLNVKQSLEIEAVILKRNVWNILTMTSYCSVFHVWNNLFHSFDIKHFECILFAVESQFSKHFKWIMALKSNHYGHAWCKMRKGTSFYFWSWEAKKINEFRIFWPLNRIKSLQNICIASIFMCLKLPFAVSL